MSWKQQKILSLAAIAAALVINCWPVQSPTPAPERTVLAAP
jgi:hypothetical protein